MPKLIRDGAIVEDDLGPVNPESVESGHLLTLEQWLALPDKSGSCVQLEPGDGAAPLLEALADIRVVAINLLSASAYSVMNTVSENYARELRERGYSGELRAVGQCIPDQLHYLTRCGFNAFQPESEDDLAQALVSLKGFSEHYQAAIDNPQPLFRRRG